MRRLAAAGLAALAAALPWLAAPAAHAASPIAAASGTAGGAKVVASRHVDARLLELTVRTPALRAATKVRVLLPTGYDRSQRRRYPVLYLLHGAGDDYRGWTRSGEVER